MALATARDKWEPSAKSPGFVGSTKNSANVQGVCVQPEYLCRLTWLSTMTSKRRANTLRPSKRLWISKEGLGPSSSNLHKYRIFSFALRPSLGTSSRIGLRDRRSHGVVRCERVSCSKHELLCLAKANSVRISLQKIALFRVQIAKRPGQEPASLMRGLRG